MIRVISGAAAAFVSVRVSGHGVRRSRYRPDRWLLPELLTVACGFVPVAAIITVGAGSGASALYPTVLPTPDIPTLPTVILVGVLVALLPSVVTPPALTAAAEVTA